MGTRCQPRADPTRPRRPPALPDSPCCRFRAAGHLETDDNGCPKRRRYASGQVGLVRLAETLDRLAGEDLLLGDGPLRPAAAEERDEPVQQRGDPGLEPRSGRRGGSPARPSTRRTRRTGACPRWPPRRTARWSPWSPCRSNGTPGRSAAGEPALDLLGRELSALDRHLGHPRQVVERDHVAEDEHLGVARQGEVGADLDATGAVGLGARLVGDRAAERAGLHAGGPHLGDRLDPAHVAGGSLTSCTSMPVASTSTTLAPSWTSTPNLREAPLRDLAEPVAERGQTLRRGVDEGDLAIVGSI